MRAHLIGIRLCCVARSVFRNAIHTYVAHFDCVVAVVVLWLCVHIFKRQLICIVLRVLCLEMQYIHTNVAHLACVARSVRNTRRRFYADP